MRLSRIVAVAALAGAAFTSSPAFADDCETNPEECYDCVMAPCHPGDWPPFLLDKVDDVLPAEG